MKTASRRLDKACEQSKNQKENRGVMAVVSLLERKTAAVLRQGLPERDSYSYVQTRTRPRSLPDWVYRFGCFVCICAPAAVDWFHRG